MNKKILSISITLLVLTGCSQQSAPTNTVATKTPNIVDTSLSQTQKISISNFAFSPVTITVKPGTTITWTNQDSAPHNVKADQASDATPNFGSETLAQGESYSYTFASTGTFNYHCSFHAMMKATVNVVQ